MGPGEYCALKFLGLELPEKILMNLSTTYIWLRKVPEGTEKKGIEEDTKACIAQEDNKSEPKESRQ